MIIPFGEWLPDWGQQVQGAAHVVLAKNVYPSGNGYGPIPQHTIVATALPERCRGVYTWIDNTGDRAQRIVLGDSTAFYRVSTAGALTKLTVTINQLGSDDYWDFTEYDDLLVVCGGPNVPFAATKGPFLSGLASLHTEFLAKRVARVNGFLVYGDVNENPPGFRIANKVRWSGFGTPALNTVGVNQADSEILQTDTDIERIFGGEQSGIILQQHAITRMSYIGTPSIFQFDTLESKRGVISHYASCKVGESVYFISHDGFYVLDGLRAVPIGNDKVDRFFFESVHGVDPSNYSRIVSARSEVLPLVMWAYPTTAASGVPNRLIIYNWKSQRWSFAEINTEYLATIGRRMSDHQYGQLVASVDSSHRLGYLNAASNYTAQIETAEYQAFQGFRSTLKTIRVLGEGFATAQPTIEVAARDIVGVTASFSASQSLQATGVAKPRNTGRYHRVRVTQGNVFDALYGIDVEHKRRGKR